MISLYQNPKKVFGILTDGDSFIFLKVENCKETKNHLFKKHEKKLLDLKNFDKGGILGFFYSLIMNEILDESDEMECL